MTDQTFTGLSEIGLHQTTEAFNEENEQEIWKNSYDINPSFKWSEFALFEKTGDKEKWNLTDIWEYPHPG